MKIYDTVCLKITPSGIYAEKIRIVEETTYPKWDYFKWFAKTNREIIVLESRDLLNENSRH